jgi:large subunit ribosomal protein L10
MSAFEREFGKPRLKAGWLEGTVVGEDRVKSLATIPSRQELYAQVTGGIGAPLAAMVGTLAALLSNLSRVIDGIRAKKEAAAS